MAAQHTTLGLIQRSSTNNPDENFSKTIANIREAASAGAQIILLQELFNTTYFPQVPDDTYFDWAESIPGPVTDKLTELAKELGVVITAPFFERRAAGLYHNSLVVIDADGSLMGTYRKKHIPDDPGFYEKYYFTPGEDAYQVFETRYAKIGPLICWDQWYPEAARITALKGAEILVYPTAIGTLPDEDEQMANEFVDAWQTIQRSHAIANGCFVASINRVGQEGDLTFWGRSFVAGPFGQMLSQAGGEEEMLLATIDLAKIEKQRQIWPFFRDRRIDTYKPILKRYID
ncbi:carbon-nitrogen hydrolase [Halalkalibaculum sp. DA384]|uniref:carbon-nitrogen hydrolase n=1 Tax=Halalkalibaculum sp. DA384 TaxID=3373606 RepID=UPI0037550504